MDRWVRFLLLSVVKYLFMIDVTVSEKHFLTAFTI